MLLYSTDEDFLLIYQATWQRRILAMYGQELCLIDATYKTTQYDLPAFSVCVATNIGYFPVAIFILGHEKKKNIQEALGILAGWNPDWQPNYVLTDFDEGQIGAIQHVFESNVQIFIQSCYYNLVVCYM